MRLLLICLILLGNLGAARADLISATFGTPQLLRPVGAQVQLERESTRVQIFYDYAQASASYEFRNLGKATTIAIAFPESGPGLDFNSQNPGFSSFLARVDGHSLATRRQILQGGDMVRRVALVPFTRGQRRRITIVCRTTPFQNLGFDSDLVYVFGGSRWLGKVSQSEVNVEFAAPSTYILNASQGTREHLEERDAVGIETRGATATFRRRNWRPSGNLLLEFTTTLSPNWLTEKGAARFEETIHVKGKNKGLLGAGFYLPSALVREGVTFMRLDALSEKFRLPKREVEYSWDKPTALRAGKQKLEFRRGSRQWKLNNRVLILPAAPFLETGFSHDSGQFSVLYVPLSPVVKALGGAANVNQKAHRFYVRLPGTLPPLGAES